MITRRGFIGSVLGAAASIAVFTKFPLEHLPGMMREMAATRFLTQEWNKYTKGKGPMHSNHELYMTLSPDLYDTFWKEQRDQPMKVPSNWKVTHNKIKVLRYRRKGQDQPVGLDLGQHPDKKWWVDFREGGMIVL